MGKHSAPEPPDEVEGPATVPWRMFIQETEYPTAPMPRVNGQPKHLAPDEDD